MPTEQAKTEYPLTQLTGRIFYASSAVEGLVRILRWLQEEQEQDKRPTPLIIRFDEEEVGAEDNTGEASVVTLFYEEPGGSAGED